MLYEHKIESDLLNILRNKGIDQEWLTSVYTTAGNIFKDINNKAGEAAKVIESACNDDDIAEIERLAAKIRDNFSEVVILGTGASSLNGLALANLAYFGSDTKLHFVNNIDPHSLDNFFTKLQLKNTAFLCISKSGNTLETLAQFLVTIDRYSAEFGASYELGKHFFVITDKHESLMYKVASEIGATLIEHPATVGRFSPLTKVGILPAAIIGLDPAKFKEGARQALKEGVAGDTNSNLIKGAIFNFALFKAGYNMHVIMPYVDRLSGFTNWYRQLWAETLSKNGIGSTPINSHGTVDQHSQLQLYLGGPRDKVFTLLTLDFRSKGAKIVPHANINSTLDGFANKTIGDLMHIEQEVTINSLIKVNNPLRRITFQELNEQTLGGLVMNSMLETLIIAGLLEVNPFNQPHVEECKTQVRKLLYQV